MFENNNEKKTSRGGWRPVKRPLLHQIEEWTSLQTTFRFYKWAEDTHSINTVVIGSFAEYESKFILAEIYVFEKACMKLGISGKIGETPLTMDVVDEQGTPKASEGWFPNNQGNGWKKSPRKSWRNPSWIFEEAKTNWIIMKRLKKKFLIECTKLGVSGKQLQRQGKGKICKSVVWPVVQDLRIQKVLRILTIVKLVS